MRSLGQFAREEELQEMLKEVDIDGNFYLLRKKKKKVVQKLIIVKFNFKFN